MPLSQRLIPKQFELDQSISLDGQIDLAGSTNHLDLQRLPAFFCG